MKIEKGNEFIYPYKVGYNDSVEKIVVDIVSDSHVWWYRTKSGRYCMTDKKTFYFKARKIVKRKG